MVQRHPHVFGNAVVLGSGEVLTRWDEIKKWEKAGKGWTEAYLPDSIEMRYEDEKQGKIYPFKSSRHKIKKN